MVASKIRNRIRCGKQAWLMVRHMLCLIGALTFFGDAGAQTIDAKPSPWRAPRAAYPWFDVAFDDEHTTGTCIGKLVSPRCAIETLFACLVRGGVYCHLAIAVTAGASTYEDYRYPDRIIRYRIASAARKRPHFARDSREHPNDVEGWRDGDVAVTVNMMTYEQSSPPEVTRGLPNVMRFVVTQTRDGWRVTSWDTDRR